MNTKHRKNLPLYSLLLYPIRSSTYSHGLFSYGLKPS